MLITKRDAALRQLNVAAVLFLAGDYLSSLTLAGAAEEMLGKEAERAGLPTSVDNIIRTTLETPSNGVPDAARKKNARRALNGPRNAAKHNGDPNEFVTVDRMQTLLMFMRALSLVKELGIERSIELERVLEAIRARPSTHVSDPAGG